MRIVNIFQEKPYKRIDYICMININGKTPRLIKINGAVPDIVKINNSIIWKDAFSIDFKANFYWGTTSHSSGCSDWNVEDIRLSGFTVTANHYFPHLYLASIKIYFYWYDNKGNSVEEFDKSYEYPDGYELKSGQTYNIDKFLYCGETDSNRLIKSDFYFYAAGNYKIQKKVSVSAYTNDLSKERAPVLSTIFSDKISAYTEREIEWIKATS